MVTRQSHARNLADIWPLLAATLSAIMLGSAWVFQYGFGYAPCQMCLWQRDAHKLVILASVGAYALGMYRLLTPRFRYGLIAAAFLISFYMAGWHVGVEYGWWEGPKTCLSGGTPTDFDPATLLDSLNTPIKTPACSDAVWHFLGLSMAGWNALVSFVAACMSMAIAWRSSGER